MNRKNKKFALIFLLSIFLGMVIPSQNTAHAEGMFDWILNPLATAARSTADGIVGAILGLVVAIPVTLLEVAQNLLSLVISPNFLGISMTGPDNVVVAYGWAITRDLANIFLLLGLVVIGLGIILGLDEYQAKKTLPRLIGIALLINFTLVICGFILDFTNLLMNYLLGAGSLSKGLSTEITNGLASLAGKDLLKSLQLVLTLFVFGIVAFVVYLMYALLFIARYVYLWILIIISPIAFVSRVFPSLSHAKQFFPSFFYWDEWWESFIQWATVGIYAAFFIALANRLMTALASGAIITTKLSVLGSIFSYLFPLALLIIGFFSILDAGSSVPGFKEIGGYAKAGLKGAAIGTAAVATGAIAGAYVGAEGSGKDGKPGTTRQQFAGAVRGALTAEGREKGIYEAKRYLEGVPLAGRVLGGVGSADKARGQELADAEKDVKSIPPTKEGVESLIKITKGTELTKKDYQRKIKAIERLAELKKLPDGVVRDNAEKFERSGEDINIILRTDPAFARYFKNSQTGNSITTQEAVDRFDGKELAKYMQKKAIDITGAQTQQEKELVEKTIIAIASNDQHFNGMKGLDRSSKLAFVDGVRDLSRNSRLPQETLDLMSQRTAETLVDPRWQ